MCQIISCYSPLMIPGRTVERYPCETGYWHQCQYSDMQMKCGLRYLTISGTGSPRMSWKSVSRLMTIPTIARWLWTLTLIVSGCVCF